MYRAKTGDKIYESTAKFTHSRDRRGQRGAQEHFGEENLRQTPEMRARAIVLVFFFLSRNSIILIFAAQSCFLLYTQWIGEFLCFVFVYFCIERRCLCLWWRSLTLSDILNRPEKLTRCSINLYNCNYRICSDGTFKHCNEVHIMTARHFYFHNPSSMRCPWGRQQRLGRHTAGQGRFRVCLVTLLYRIATKWDFLLLALVVLANSLAQVFGSTFCLRFQRDLFIYIWVSLFIIN